MKNKQGFIYIIKCLIPDNNNIIPKIDKCNFQYYKIGYTTHNPKVRLNTIQTNCPFTLELINWWKVDNVYLVEQFFHYVLTKYHYNGEWFYLPINLVIEITQLSLADILQSITIINFDKTKIKKKVKDIKRVNPFYTNNLQLHKPIIHLN